MSNRHNKLSRLLCYVLRHRPDALGIELDAQGWTDVHQLIAKHNTVRTPPIDFDMVKEVVFTDSKSRYAFDDSGDRIRANQGHSIQVLDLKLETAIPPPVLYHGTSQDRRTALEREGIQPMTRLHVHLSAYMATAYQVGRRHGIPVILHVDAARMVADGITFWLSENGVWLTSYVHPKYIIQPTEENA